MAFRRNLVRLELDSEGVRSAMEALRELKKSAQKRIVRPAARYAFSPVLASSRRKVARRSGALAKSFVEKIYTKGAKVFAVVKPDEKAKDASTGEVPFRIAHFVEFGTEPHDIRVGGRTIHHPGSAPKPFLRPALMEQRDNVVERFRKKIEEGIDKEVGRLAKRTHNKKKGASWVRP